MGITGEATGASIGIMDGAGNAIALNTASNAQDLQDGNNNLTFAAYVQADSVDVPVTPGEFRGVTNFTLAYQ